MLIYKRNGLYNICLLQGLQLFMQKLISRIGTQTKKFEFILRFQKIYIFSLIPHNNTLNTYRIIIKRDKKKYSSDFFKVIPNHEFELHQQIKLSVTMYYQTKKRSYQQKKFEIIVYKKQKDHIADTEVASFMFMAQNHISSRDQFKVLKDLNDNRIQLRVSSSQITNQSYDKSNSDQNSPQKKKDIPSKPKKWQKKQFNSITNNFLQKSISFKESQFQISQQQKKDDQVIQDVKFHSSKNLNQRKGNQQSQSPVKLRNKNNDTTTKSRSPGVKNIIQPKQQSIKNRFHKVNKIKQINQKPISYGPLETMIKQNLYDIQEKLTESRIRNSTLYEQLKNEKDKQLEKSKLFCQQLKKINSKLNYEIQDLLKQKEQFLQKNSELTKKYMKLVKQNRELKELKDQLHNKNNENLKNLEKGIKPSKSNKNLDQHERYIKQIQQLKKSRNKYCQELQDLKHQKQILQNKNTEILMKYNKTFNQLKIQKMFKEQQIKLKQASERKVEQIYRKKQQQIYTLRREIRYLQFRLMNPEEQLNQNEHSLLQDRLEKLIKDLSEETKQNSQIQEILKKQLNQKKKQLNDWMQKCNNIQKKRLQQIHSSEVKQKSLIKAIEIKQKKILQLMKQNQIYKQKAHQSKNFIQSQKAQILVKIEYLTTQLERRKSSQEQLMQAQLKIKQLTLRTKNLSEQNLEFSIESEKNKQKLKKLQKLQKQNLDGIKLVTDLQNQLVKTKMKIAQIVQLVFQTHPSLGQAIIQIK